MLDIHHLVDISLDSLLYYRYCLEHSLHLIDIELTRRNHCTGDNGAQDYCLLLGDRANLELAGCGKNKALYNGSMSI